MYKHRSMIKLRSGSQELKKQKYNDKKIPPPSYLIKYNSLSRQETNYLSRQIFFSPSLNYFPPKNISRFKNIFPLARMMLLSISSRACENTVSLCIRNDPFPSHPPHFFFLSFIHLFISMIL